MTRRKEARCQVRDVRIRDEEVHTARTSKKRKPSSRCLEKKKEREEYGQKQGQPCTRLKSISAHISRSGGGKRFGKERWREGGGAKSGRCCSSFCRPSSSSLCCLVGDAPSWVINGWLLREAGGEGDSPKQGRESKRALGEGISTANFVPRKCRNPPQKPTTNSPPPFYQHDTPAHRNMIHNSAARIMDRPFPPLDSILNGPARRASMQPDQKFFCLPCLLMNLVDTRYLLLLFRGSRLRVLLPFP